MKKKLLLALLILAALFFPATNLLAQSSLDSLVFEGRVVNMQGIPLNGAVVSAEKGGIFGSTGIDGLFKMQLAMEGDVVSVRKEGLKEFQMKINSNEYLVIILGDTVSTFMGQREYIRQMQPTAKIYFEEGKKFLNGVDGAEPDYKKAIACFWRAVNMDHQPSAYYLGKMFDEGIGTVQSYANAIKWYKKAHDHADAQRRLGEMYAEGLGVKQDSIMSIIYYHSAVMAGDSSIALSRLNKMQEELDERIPNFVYLFVEKDASFPGGDDACYAWLAQHIKYPKIANEQGIQGRVFVQFVVDKDGSISDIKVPRSPHPALSQEGVRVVSLMPKWNPANNNGKPVRKRFNLPIMFRLQ